MAPENVPMPGETSPPIFTASMLHEVPMEPALSMTTGSVPSSARTEFPPTSEPVIVTFPSGP